MDRNALKRWRVREREKWRGGERMRAKVSRNESQGAPGARRTRAGARHSPRGGGGEAGQAGQQHVQRRRGPAGVERRLDAGGGVERQPRPRGRLAAPLGPAPAAEAARVAARAGGVAAVAGTHVEGPRGARGAGWRRRVLVLARAVDGRRAVQVSGWGRGAGGPHSPSRPGGRPPHPLCRGHHPTHTLHTNTLT